MVAGRVVRFDSMRGYGFISPVYGGDDVFLHVNDLLVPEGYMRPGVDVEFEIQDGDKGLKAAAVRLAQSPDAPLARVLVPPQDPAPRALVPQDPAPPEVAQLPAPDSDTDPLCDVLDEDEYVGEVTEVLLHSVPTLTGDQILRIRKALVTFGSSHGWIDSDRTEGH
ncbi:cold-shock protein [Streptomyces sp. NPDC048527]|uniref:cold-shock protein n=1 Tax=Streptomyces sp. NPDC048527 TaxID=3365568 RepID=UPI003721E301